MTPCASARKKQNRKHEVGTYSGGIVVGLGSVTVTNGSRVNGHSNNGSGGGIAANFGGRVTVSNGSQVNDSTGAALGGGIFHTRGIVTIDQGHVDGNRAPHGNGGGIWNGGVFNTRLSTLSGNTASGVGGGLFNSANGHALVSNSTVAGNQATFGGGMVTEGELTVVRSTIADNKASRQGGGIYCVGVDPTLVDMVFSNNDPDNLAGC